MTTSEAPTIQQILTGSNAKELRAFFAFDKNDDRRKVLFKFNLWARYFFPQYFTSLDAPFHADMDANNLAVYRGALKSFINIAFRGGAKTARTKLFIAFVVANDMDQSRRYFKILSADKQNATQIVTDIYNSLVYPRVAFLYPELFQRTNQKREETMSSFTTATGIKIIADSVGTDQRGAIMEDARPDFLWLEDFENRTTLRSAKKTKAIADNIEEARTGLAKDGGAVFTCNYISEAGNVHQLVIKPSPFKCVQITPIIANGTPSWPTRYTLADIDYMRETDDDFEGERLCQPSASKDVLFDRDSLDQMPVLTPLKVVANFKIFKDFNPSHRYASGHDVAGGVGLDSSTSVFIDFDTVPAQVVGTFANNNIRPDIFGDEIDRESNMFGNCVAAIEKNNHGHATIARARQLGVNLFQTQPKDTRIAGTEPEPTEYGWHTNALTKPKMLFALAKAIEDGLIELNDPDLINEAKGYSRNDLLDDEPDARLSTRHHDLLMAVAIAWQMKDHSVSPRLQHKTPRVRQNMTKWG